MFKRKIKITRIKKDQEFDEIDEVLIEKPIDLFLNGNPLVNIVCLPKDLKELCIGFLFSIGIINSFEDISILKVDSNKGQVFIELIDSIPINLEDFNQIPISRVIDTSCGIPSPWARIIEKAIEKTKEKIFAKDYKIHYNVILSAIIKMQKQTHLFKETGGAHGAAIFDLDGQIICVKEDIGRHNAIDKVIGDLLIKGHDFNDIFLTSTGRLTGDSVLKTIRAKIPIVASISAAIESGIKLALAYGITLIGFVRGKRMNIYTHMDRILTK